MSRATSPCRHHAQRRFDDLVSSICPSGLSVITQCCIHELYLQGKSHQPATDLAKSFERRKCNHKEAIPGNECIAAVVGGSPSSYTLARPLFLFFCPPLTEELWAPHLRRHQQTSIRDRDAVEPSPRSPPRHPRSAHRARKSLRHGPRASQRRYTPIQTARTLRGRLSTNAIPFTHTLEYLTDRAECARTVYIRKGYAECSRTSGRT